MAARRCHPILGAGANFSPSLHQWFPAPLHHSSHPLVQDRPCQLTSPARWDLRNEKRRTLPHGVRLFLPVLDPIRRMTGEHLLPFSASPRRIGALGNSIIVGGGPVHRSLNRWFTRPVHSDEGFGFTPSKTDN